MKPDPRSQSLAYLWLYSAGVDPANLDAAGDSLALSLAKLLHKHHLDGRREAAGRYLKAVEETDDEVTGEYPAVKMRELEGK